MSSLMSVLSNQAGALVYQVPMLFLWSYMHVGEGSQREDMGGLTLL